MTVSLIQAESKRCAKVIGDDLYLKMKIAKCVSTDEKIKSLEFFILARPWQITKKTKYFLELESFTKCWDHVSFEPAQEIEPSSQLEQVKFGFSLVLIQSIMKAFLSAEIYRPRGPLRRMELNLTLKIKTDLKEVHLKASSCVEV